MKSCNASDMASASVIRQVCLTTQAQQHNFGVAYVWLGFFLLGHDRRTLHTLVLVGTTCPDIG